MNLCPVRSNMYARQGWKTQCNTIYRRSDFLADSFSHDVFASCHTEIRKRPVSKSITINMQNRQYWQRKWTPIKLVDWIGRERKLNENWTTHSQWFATRVKYRKWGKKMINYVCYIYYVCICIYSDWIRISILKLESERNWNEMRSVFNNNRTEKENQNFLQFRNWRNKWRRKKICVKWTGWVQSQNWCR